MLAWGGRREGGVICLHGEEGHIPLLTIQISRGRKYYRQAPASQPPRSRSTPSNVPDLGPHHTVSQI